MPWSDIFKKNVGKGSSQPLCSEGEEPEEDGVGGITCVPAGTVPQPQPVFE